MALLPAPVDIIAFFYPIGNTPAFCTTQELPPEDDATVLLLGCGDARNVLYTTYCNRTSQRKLDFTCCDHESAVLARNLILYSLLLEDNANERLSQIWAIYFHFYLNTAELKLLEEQANKLVDFSKSQEAWKHSRYGKILTFCDENTLEAVRSTWQSYCTQNSDTDRSTILKHRINATKDFAKKVRGEFQNLTGSRSAAPIWTKSMKDLPECHEKFWKTGIATDNVHDVSLANPMFASPLSNATMLHYGVDPLHGFHLSIAYAPLTKESPFHLKGVPADNTKKLFAAVKKEFETWASAFSASRDRIRIRFVAGDAINVCRTFSRRQVSKDFTRPIEQTLPSYFNVVDTSNLIDHLGILNLLPAAAELLSDSPNATLYTELLVKQGKSLIDTGSRLLLGDLPAITLFLGLYPVEYWTGISLISPEDANMNLMLDSMPGMMSKGSSGQAHCRMSWKKKIKPRPIVNADAVAELLYSIYHNMFAHENVSKTFERLTAGDSNLLTSLSLIKYHRGSFVTLISHFRAHVSTDWVAVMDKLTIAIESDRALMLGFNYIQELYTYLHLHQFYTPEVFLKLPDTSQERRNQQTWRQWPDIPPVLCLTVKVPRNALRPLTDTTEQPGKIGTPFIQGCVHSSPSYPGRPWENLFASCQMLFGSLSSNGDPASKNYALHVECDANRWQGNSPLIFSFLVPTWVMIQEEDTALVSVMLNQSPQVTHALLSKLGPSFALFKTSCADADSVFVSKDFPVAKGYSYSGIYGPIVSSKPELSHQDASDSMTWTMNLDKNHRLSTITARLTFDTGPGLECLRDQGSVKTNQVDAYTFRIDISKSSQVFHYTTTYPVPVSWGKSSTRIARKSGYVEVTAPVLRAVQTNKDPLLYLPFKVEPLATPPTAWNITRLNIDLQPTLDIQKTQDLQWLITHVSMQMSSKEREMRQAFLHSPQPCPDPLVDLKDSLLSLFMHYTGLQGQKRSIFGLSSPDEGGIHTMVLVSKLKLDLGNQTAFLDAAVLPLSPDILNPLSSFLGPLSRNGKLCQIKVTPAERKLWQQVLPLYVERCRDWSHTGSCAYKTAKRIPLSMEKDRSPICECGKGKFPDTFVPEGVADWKKVKKYCYRAAITPLFSVPYVDEGYQGKSDGEKDACIACGKTEGLQVCAGCKGVSYCSRECQKVHWKHHKAMCKSAAGFTK